jgi:hypothetical protein
MTKFEIREGLTPPVTFKKAVVGQYDPIREKLYQYSHAKIGDWLTVIIAPEDGQTMEAACNSVIQATRNWMQVANLPVNVKCERHIMGQTKLTAELWIRFTEVKDVG